MATSRAKPAVAGTRTLGLALVILCGELRGLLRDRRALFAGVILPVLLYPLMFLLNGKLEQVARSNMAEREVQIACDFTRLEPGLAEELTNRLQALPATEITTLDASFWYANELALHEGRQDAVDAELREARLLLARGPSVLLIGGPHPILPARPLLRMCHSKSDEASGEAQARVESLLTTLREELRDQRLAVALGAQDPGRWLLPSIVDVADPSATKGAALGRLLPVIAILAVLSAGAYAALSSFAGEREAQTLETLLVQPVPARAIVAGKYAAVALLALCAVIGNLASFQVTVSLGWLSLPGLDPAAAADARLDWLRIALALLAVVPATLLICALLVLVSARARTFREGQQLLFPLTMACVIPAGLAGSTDVALDTWTACVPVFGASLALRDAMRGTLAQGPLALCSLAHVGWTLLCMRSMPGTIDAERIFATSSSEEEQTQRQVQSRAALMWGLTGVIATYMLRDWLQSLSPVGGLLITLLLILPALALFCARGVAKRAKERVVQVLGLVRCAPGAVLGALMLAPGLALVMREWIHWQQRLLPMPTRALEQGTGLEFLMELSLPALLALVALAPAIGEELFFRGAVLSGLRRDHRPLKALLVQAALFAAAHASIYRFLPTLAVGLLAGTLRLGSKSLWPAMALHAAYNGWVVSTERFEVLRDPAWAALTLPGLLILWAVWERRPAASAALPVA